MHTNLKRNVSGNCCIQKSIISNSTWGDTTDLTSWFTTSIHQLFLLLETIMVTIEIRSFCVLCFYFMIWQGIILSAFVPVCIVWHTCCCYFVLNFNIECTWCLNSSGCMWVELSVGGVIWGWGWLRVELYVGGASVGGVFWRWSYLLVGRLGMGLTENGYVWGWSCVRVGLTEGGVDWGWIWIVDSAYFWSLWSNHLYDKWLCMK